MPTPPASLTLKQVVRNPSRLAGLAAKDARLVEELIAGLNAKEARVRYGCAKALRAVGEAQPELLYPHFDFFAGLLRHENKIFQWEAAFVLSQFARVDTRQKLAGIFAAYFAPISGPVMITAANVIRGGARIARAKPHLGDRIAAEILKVERARYQTTECRNVAIGHAILALGEMVDLLGNRAPVLRFVQRQVSNRRPATCTKARQFLKRVAP